MSSHIVQVKIHVAVTLIRRIFWLCAAKASTWVTFLPSIFSSPLNHFMTRTLAVTLYLYRLSQARIKFVVVLVRSVVCTKKAATPTYVRYVEFKVWKPYDLTAKIDIMFKVILSLWEQPDFWKWTFRGRRNLWRDGKSLPYLFLVEGFLAFVQHLLVYPLIFILICMQQGTSGMNL